MKLFPGIIMSFQLYSTENVMYQYVYIMKMY